MTERQVKIGIVGIGNMGSTHIRHVIGLPTAKLAAICDRRTGRLDAAMPGLMSRATAITPRCSLRLTWTPSSSPRRISTIPI